MRHKREVAMNWDKELFVEVNETMQILPPKAGLPPGLDGFLKNGVLNQPLIRRKSPLSNDWAHINMARATRPFAHTNLKLEQKDCFFCRGHEDRTPGVVNTGGDFLRVGEDSWTLRAFPNLYPWMIHHLNVVETADHKVSMAELDDGEEFNAWCAIAEITRKIENDGVFPMLFRNHGFGSSVAHYHWQIGALPSIPNHIQAEVETAKAFYDRWKTNIFDALVKSEQKIKARLIDEDDHCAVISAYAPRTAFETWIVCKTSVTSVADLNSDCTKSLCSKLNTLLRKLHNDIKIESMNIIFHQLPNNDSTRAYRLHIEVMPFKHLGGAERGFGEYAIEVTPERAAEMLKQAIGC